MGRSVRGDENALKLIDLCLHHCEYDGKNHWIVHLSSWIFYELQNLYIKKIIPLNSSLVPSLHSFGIYKQNRVRWDKTNNKEDRESKWMSYPSDVLNKGPWSPLTCVNGTWVMVSEGAAFVVAAQGGTRLLAVGTFLQGRKKSGMSASQTPSPPGLPQTPLVRPQHVSLRLPESGGRAGCQFPTATHWPHHGSHPAAAFQARPPEYSQINQTEQHTGPQPCLWCSRCPPAHCLPVLPSLHPHHFGELLTDPARLFLLWKSGVGREGEIVELYISLLELKVEFSF